MRSAMFKAEKKEKKSLANDEISDVNLPPGFEYRKRTIKGKQLDACHVCCRCTEFSCIVEI